MISDNIAYFKSAITPDRRMIPFFVFLFLVVLITRLPALFNDFYDVDELAAIVQTKEWLAGYIPGVDFSESKLPLYHAIFKISYLILPSHGWVLVHLCTILIVFFTAMFIYSFGKKIGGSHQGAIGATMYAFFISSFNRHFMATNGEIIYNLPVTAAAFFFIHGITEKALRGKVISFLACALSVFAATQIKFHGIIALIFIVIILFIYIPWRRGFLGRIFLIILAGISVALIAFLTHPSLHPIAAKTVLSLKVKLFYAIGARTQNPLVIGGLYLYRQMMLVFWHFAAWTPACVLVFAFIKKRFRENDLPLAGALILFILTLAMVFGGGARFYYHYFMAAYPALCVVSSYAITQSGSPLVRFIRRHLTAFLLIPALFFFSWNMKDIAVKHFYPESFYKESKAAFWFRAIFVSSMNDYLLPNPSYLATIDFIRNNTSSKDTIFVWGDGPQLYYFADRRIAVRHVWPKNDAMRIENYYHEGSASSVARAQQIEDGYITIIDKKKPVLIIDTSPKGLHVWITKLSEFAKFPHPLPPRIRKYVARNYSVAAHIDGFTIYRRIRD
jgi:hypothetical protein